MRLHRLRFQLWCLVVRARLRRHGMALRVEAAGRPCAFGLPRLELTTGARGGTLTLRLGEHVHLGRAMVLEVLTGADATLACGTATRFGAYGRVQLLGGTISLGEAVDVRDLCLLKARGTIDVGDRVVLSRAVNVHATERVTIGAHAGIGERTTIIDSDHAADGSATPHLEQPLLVAPVEVGANVNVGANAVIVRGARIGPDAVVAAGSVVTAGEHPGGWLLAGAPAKPRRALQEEQEFPGSRSTVPRP
ncbi:MAG: acyltransferase [Solirubrobacterales bacterium]|nr:acyltransferase [Solirubrobacterales bacterium]